ncbi:MAG: fumarylacetoacetate hydrolase family protein [Dehalococcoidia bacterium]
MRLVTCLTDGESHVGVRRGDEILPTGYTDMESLIRDGDVGKRRVQEHVESAEPLPDVRITAPLLRPGKMLFCGMNYHGHVTENPDAVLPEEPFFFSKVASSIVGDGDAIVLPYPETETDWEVELALVIGRAARNLDPERALDHVFGYTIVNDVSAREIQFKDAQITLGKNLDSYCPMGPDLVTADEFGDPSTATVRSYVNGEMMQDTPTSDMIFDVPHLLAFLTRLMRLEPGDVITTGTPAGVGTFRSPPRYLQPGDEATMEVDRIGRLTNSVVAGW